MGDNMSFQESVQKYYRLPFFSIVIPCYNIEKYLRYTLDSIISQDFVDFEIIAVNDGSTDKTLEILHEAAHEDQRIRIIDQKNVGVSVARNIGMANAKGTYICFFDGDDFMSEGTLKHCAKNILMHPSVDLFCMGYRAVYLSTDESKQYMCQNFNECIIESGEAFRLFLKRQLYIHMGSFFCRRNVITSKKIQFLSGCKIGEDIRFMLQMLQSVRKVHYSSRISFVYQIHNDSAMHGYRQVRPEHCEIFTAYKIDMSQFQHLQYDYNIFMAISYVSLLVRYLRYSKSDNIVENIFIQNRYLINIPVNMFSKQGFIIAFAKLLPITKIFAIKHNIHSK